MFAAFFLSGGLIGAALAGVEAPSTSRFGIGLTAAGADAVGVGLHLSGTAPAGAARAAMRLDHRAWRHPTQQEEGLWEDQGVIDLPEHWQSRMGVAVGARWTLEGPRLEPGVEASAIVARWRTASAAVQDEYADLGATIWPLSEVRAGAELRAGGFGPEDWLHLAGVGRIWLPVYAKLDGEGGRYEVDGRRFDPVEVINPLVEVGGVAMGRAGPTFGQVEVVGQGWLASEKNREIDQRPPEGGLGVEVVIGIGF